MIIFPEIKTQRLRYIALTLPLNRFEFLYKKENLTTKKEIGLPTQEEI